MLPTDAASKTTMPSSKGIRLHDEDEKASSRGKCLSAVAAFPGLIVASMGQFFAACCSCTRPTDDETEDDCETLLDALKLYYVFSFGSLEPFLFEDTNGNVAYYFYCQGIAIHGPFGLGP
ncbi:hypothetical protein X797_002560 [Metarhizium robertsii]|uniref:Uncharacterized protein n=1 Tax=Metarhizium robertsii TaxID=568076 RepID=A0A0A1V4W7_9HYPO|nr:hypothetical protein X797_002560 [Metarhizium robertsii]